MTSPCAWIWRVMSTCWWGSRGDLYSQSRDLCIQTLCGIRIQKLLPLLKLPTLLVSQKSHPLSKSLILICFSYRIYRGRRRAWVGYGCARPGDRFIAWFRPLEWIYTCPLLEISLVQCPLWSGHLKKKDANITLYCYKPTISTNIQSIITFLNIINHNLFTCIGNESISKKSKIMNKNLFIKINQNSGLEQIM
jgi:hypothetical protein